VRSDALAPTHRVLQGGENLGTGQLHRDQQVIERLESEEVAVAHRAGEQLRPDAAVVHQRDLRSGGHALGVGDQVAERDSDPSRVSGSLEMSDHPLHQRPDLDLVTLHERDDCRVGGHLVHVGDRLAWTVVTTLSAEIRSRSTDREAGAVGPRCTMRIPFTTVFTTLWVCPDTIRSGRC
jgi:hypothetical protein